jgi:hypothetical protein
LEDEVTTIPNRHVLKSDSGPEFQAASIAQATLPQSNKARLAANPVRPKALHPNTPLL